MAAQTEDEREPLLQDEDVNEAPPQYTAYPDGILISKVLLLRIF